MIHALDILSRPTQLNGDLKSAFIAKNTQVQYIDFTKNGRLDLVITVVIVQKGDAKMKIDTKSVTLEDFYKIYCLATNTNPDGYSFEQFKGECFFDEDGTLFHRYKAYPLTFSLHMNGDIEYNNAFDRLELKNLGSAYDIVIKYL